MNDARLPRSSFYSSDPSLTVVVEEVITKSEESEEKDDCGSSPTL